MSLSSLQRKERGQPLELPCLDLGDAQIILFPGVRYERWTDDSRNAMSERSSESEAEQGERDWLEV